MSEASRDLDVSAEPEKFGPDYFSFYTREVEELLSQELPRADGVVAINDGSTRYCNGKRNIPIGSMFSNGIASSLSDSGLERLKALLRQSVVAFSNEVDEMLDPVLAVHRIQSLLSCKKAFSHSLPAASKGDGEQPPCKKIKLFSSSSSREIHLHDSSSESSGNECNVEDGKPNDIKKTCGRCCKIKSSMWGTGQENLCNSCRTESGQGRGNSLKKYQNKESSLASNPSIDDDDKDVDDHLQLILENENDVNKVEQSVKEHSEELSTTLGQMEHWLEELLNTITSSCRLMALPEKQQLLKLIQQLPPTNLDRVVEIIKRKPVGKCSSDEIFVDLEKQDNATLWRLYCYVQAVENARKLADAGISEAS